jgi:CYTH domain-containing protein
MTEIELEKTYLVKHLPEDLAGFPHKEIIDIYVPRENQHPILRIRRKGNLFEITKKQPRTEADASEQEEHTIKLSGDEFSALAAIKGKRIRKTRYDYRRDGIKAEIDVFQDDLAGLALADFEFSDPAEKDSFKMPEFCLADVTNDETFAGGMLCGKKYSDIESNLNRLGYRRIGR